MNLRGGDIVLVVKLLIRDIITSYDVISCDIMLAGDLMVVASFKFGIRQFRDLAGSVGKVESRSAKLLSFDVFQIGWCAGVGVLQSLQLELDHVAYAGLML